MTLLEGGQPPHLSLIVPAFNEERRIGESMRHIAEFLSQLPYETEVVAVDDGSGEDGRKAVESAVTQLPDVIGRKIVRHHRNRGKGAAVRSGFEAANGAYVAFIDADLATPPEELWPLVEALDAGADMAIGVRRQADGSDMRNERSLARRLAGRAYTAVMQVLLLRDISDSQCPLKAFRQETCERLFALQRIETWSFDAELLFLARKLNLKVVQVPVRWHAVAGSRLRLGPGMVAELLNPARIRWVHRKVASGR